MAEENENNEGGQTGADELEALKAEKARLEVEVAAARASGDKAHQEGLARAKAEGELNALKSVLEAQKSGQVHTVSEDQWKQLEETTGVSRNVFITNAQIAKEQIDIAKKELMGEVRAANDKAQKAQERFESLASERSLERVTKDFYDEKPQYAKYKKDVSEFVGKFPESDRQDPTKLKDIMSMAEVYVRGKVGGKMQVTPGGSMKLGEGGNEMETDSGSGSGDINTIGLQTDAQVRTVRGLKAKMDTDEREKQEKLLDRFQSSDKEGVVYSAETEWAESKASFKR